MKKLIAWTLAFILAGSAELRAAADLCQGLVKNDKANHPVPAGVSKPAVGGQPLDDPTFHTRIIRVTDVQASHPSSYGIKPVYSTMPAWNADETYFVLYRIGGGHMLYDGRTYARIRDLPIDPPDLEQIFWHTTDPDALYWVDNRVLMRYRPSTNSNQTVRDFSRDDANQPFCTGQVNSGADPVFNSWDSNVFAFKCTNPQMMFIYEVAANRITARRSTGADLPPQLGPSGQRILWQRGVTDAALNYQRSIAILEYDSHASLGRMVDGRDFYAAVAFDPPDREGCIEPEPVGCSNATFSGNQIDFAGNLVYYDLNSTADPILPHVVIGEKTGYDYPQTTHISADIHKNPGWVLVTVDDDEDNPNGTDLLDQELIYANLATDDVCRVAHHRSHGKGNEVVPEAYFAEAHGSPSPTGTRILFGSDWGGGPTIDTYVVELPSYNSSADALPPARPRGLRVR